MHAPLVHNKTKTTPQDPRHGPTEGSSRRAPGRNPEACFGRGLVCSPIISTMIIMRKIIMITIIKMIVMIIMIMMILMRSCPADASRDAQP